MTVDLATENHTVVYAIGAIVPASRHLHHRWPGMGNGALPKL